MSDSGATAADTQTTGSTLSYRHLSYEVARKGGNRKRLIDEVSVDVRAGELLAIMGPSGAGKSTLLDLMSFRKTAMEGGSAYLNGKLLTASSMHKVSNFVEQDDALLGVLTVRESVTYALRLSLPHLSRIHVKSRVERVLTALGLQGCSDQHIGTPIQRGISGGQKRRVTAACAMVIFPRILLLDEVTSGLDSTAAREVISSIKNLAQAEGIIIIATIHQPSLSTLSQFSKIMLLSGGEVCWYGKPEELEGWFEGWGWPVDKFNTPVEHAMNFLNKDFGSTTSLLPPSEPQPTASTPTKPTISSFRTHYLSTLAPTWSPPSLPHSSSNEKYQEIQHEREEDVEEGKAGYYGTLFWNTVVLSERSAKNYSRNLLAYGVRLGMYAGMGLMLATIWIRLGDGDSKINDRLSVHFYSVAFLAFMSVAGIPGFLEERAVYYRETKNGLYTTLPFVLSNTLVNIPFLFLCTLVFTLICYWAIGLHMGGTAFFRYLAFLFLAIWAAESQVLIIASLLPIFVAALAIGAFMNGFWMSVGGYFIKARSLPRFWFYSFHYMDYQKYAFEMLTNSDFRGLTFKCTTISNGTCTCAYPSSTPSTCTLSGQDVLDYLEIGKISLGKWGAILVCITVIYRIGLFVALKMRTS